MSFTSFKVTGEADDFLLVNNCSGGYIEPNTSCSIVISFRPVSAGSKSATLVITDNAASTSQSVTLTGASTGG